MPTPFARLVARVQACRACPRMEGRARVLGPANGRVPAAVLFVAEAPGRLGADRCGVPLAGDQTGRAFATLLRAAGLDRAAVFVTNAVLCNPRDARGRNARPTAAEIANCTAHLRATLEAVRPRYVAALGQVALAALARVAPHGAVLARDVGRPLPWHGGWLVPLYHPGPRARIHRPLARQLDDFRRLGQLVAPRRCRVRGRALGAPQRDRAAPVRDAVAGGASSSSGWSTAT
ncbi:MAG: uracil-DNA glycosylase [Chloroflexi bacterium]|nr:uracil-DNA glycosylase [Chloroflexota bacterium]MBI4507822.1 uracil-DNA glycosylase [Chloroflexota bacterium]